MEESAPRQEPSPDVKPSASGANNAAECERGVQSRWRNRLRPLATRALTFLSLPLAASVLAIVGIIIAIVGTIISYVIAEKAYDVAADERRDKLLPTLQTVSVSPAGLARIAASKENITVEALKITVPELIVPGGNIQGNAKRMEINFQPVLVGLRPYIGETPVTVEAIEGIKKLDDRDRYRPNRILRLAEKAEPPEFTIKSYGVNVRIPALIRVTYRALGKEQTARMPCHVETLVVTEPGKPPAASLITLECGNPYGEGAHSLTDDALVDNDIMRKALKETLTDVAGVLAATNRMR